MEKWFKRRLEKIESFIFDFKNSSYSDSKFLYLLRKIRNYKTRKPWNLTRKRYEDQSTSGTSTPFSHYSSKSSVDSKDSDNDELEYADIIFEEDKVKHFIKNKQKNNNKPRISKDTNGAPSRFDCMTDLSSTIVNRKEVNSIDQQNFTHSHTNQTSNSRNQEFELIHRRDNKPSFIKNVDYNKIYQTEDNVNTNGNIKNTDIFNFATEKMAIEQAPHNKICKSDEKKSSPYFTKDIAVKVMERSYKHDILSGEKQVVEHSQDDDSFVNYTQKSDDRENSHFNSFGNRSELLKSDNNGQNPIVSLETEKNCIIEPSKFGKKIARTGSFDKSESKPINTSHQDLSEITKEANSTKRPPSKYNFSVNPKIKSSFADEDTTKVSNKQNCSDKNDNKHKQEMLSEFNENPKTFDSNKTPIVENHSTMKKNNIQSSSDDKDREKNSKSSIRSINHYEQFINPEETDDERYPDDCNGDADVIDLELNAKSNSSGSKRKSKSNKKKKLQNFQSNPKKIQANSHKSPEPVISNKLFTDENCTTNYTTFDIDKTNCTHM